jgi:hypothetical protein
MYLDRHRTGRDGRPSDLSECGQQETLAIAFMFPVTGHRALRQRDMIRDRQWLCDCFLMKLLPFSHRNNDDGCQKWLPDLRMYGVTRKG